MKLKFPIALYICMLTCLSAFGQMKTDSRLIGTRFPIIESSSLSGQNVVLPDDTEGQITLVTIAFLEAGQPYIDSWAEPYLEEYFAREGFNYFEVPLLNAMPQNAKDYIDSGMRAGIDKKLHPNVVTFYGDYNNYVKALDLNDLRSGYAFLLDRKGTIIFHGAGMMSQNDWDQIKKVIEDHE